MDNVNIKISNEKIYIKKGFLKKIYFFVYYLIIIFLFIFLALGELSTIYFFNKALEIINNIPLIVFLIKLNYVILFFSIILHTNSFGIAMYLEIIVCDEEIRIFTPNYDTKFNYNFLNEIKISPFYGYTSLRHKNATFRGDFKDRSTIKFITKDGKEYEWGYSLSYQKGMEIKRILEERIKEKEV